MTVTAGAVAARAPTLTVVADFAFLGSSPRIGSLLLMLLAWVAWRWRIPRLAMLLSTSMGLSLGATQVLKDLFGRVRPPAFLGLGPVLGSCAFPSGHTLNATVFFGRAALLLATQLRTHVARFAVLLVWLFVCVGVGFSRGYLGYHWLTDVTGGFVIGLVVQAITMLTPTFTGDQQFERCINPFPGAATEGPQIRRPTGSTEAE